jgi:hypothetical protein
LVDIRVMREGVKPADYKNRKEQVDAHNDNNLHDLFEHITNTMFPRGK